MTVRPAIWGAALAVSLTAHVAAAAALVWATRPEDVPVQTPPETQLELAAYQVQRSQARETEPEAEAATSGDTGGAQVGQGAIPVSQAEAQSVAAVAVAPTRNRAEPARAAPVPTGPAPQQDLTGDRIATQSPTATVLAPTEALVDVTAAQTVSPTSAIPVTAASFRAPAVQPTEASMALLSTDTTALPAVTATGTSVTPIAASGTLVTPAIAAALPTRSEEPPVDRAQAQAFDAATPSPARPAVPVATPSTPDQVALDSAPPEVDSVPQLVPPVDRAKASLAFAAAGDGPVDPVSLTAFQSFMSPGDLGQAAAEVRDGIAATLSAIPCSRLQIRYDPDENVVIMSGHVPESGLRSEVLAAMQNKMGADIPVREDLLVLPRPQCGALSGIAQVGLPQSTDQITNPLLLGEDTHAREFTYVDGQALVLDLQGADYDAYVYVDFFDAGGNVLHLRPNEFTPMQVSPAKSALTIGSERELAPGEPGLHIRIGPPYGQEIAVAFAASDRLYEGTRPLVEPAEPYLDWLRVRVAEARATNPDFKGEWVYFFVSTAAE